MSRYSAACDEEQFFWKFLFFCYAHHHALHNAEYNKRCQIHQHHTGTGRSGKSVGEDDSEQEAYNRQHTRADNYTAEALKDPHGSQRRENNQAGDQHSAHHPHAEDDGDCR